MRAKLVLVRSFKNEIHSRKMGETDGFLKKIGKWEKWRFYKKLKVVPYTVIFSSVRILIKKSKKNNVAVLKGATNTIEGLLGTDNTEQPISHYNVTPIIFYLGYVCKQE